MAFRINNRATGPIRKPKRRTKADKVPLPIDGQRQPRQTDNNYLAALRLCPCVVCLTDRNIEAAHVRIGSPAHGKRSTGMAEKPDDKWCVSLCQTHHRAQHATAERRFWQELGVDVFGLCERLYEARHDVESMREIVLYWKEDK